MANSDNAFGLRAVGHITGNSIEGKARPYYVAATYGTAIFPGDPVVRSGTANTASVTVPGLGEFPPGTLAEVEQGAAGGPFVGVCVGVGANPDNLSRTYLPASTGGVIWVIDDPGVIYEIQEVSGGTALAAVSVGLNASVVVGSGNTQYGQSGVELDNSTEATTAGLELKILGLVNREDNAIGEHAKWIVLINDHQNANATAGI